MPRTIQAPKTVSEQVFERLRDEILNGSLKPGQKLVETRLAESFGVSRIPIREAIQRLLSEGLALQGARSVEVSGVGIEEIESLYGLRIALEAHAAERAAARADETDRKRLTALSGKVSSALEKAHAEKVYVALTDFHEAVVQASHCGRTKNLLAKVNGCLLRLRHRGIPVYGNTTQAAASCSKIAQAINDGDRQGAAQAVRRDGERMRTAAQEAAQS